jgi:hypothetical protein
VVALSHVVDEDDGEAEVALEPTEVAEEARDLRCAVFVEGVEAHQGVEEEELWTEPVEGGLKPVSMVFEVEPGRA